MWDFFCLLPVQYATLANRGFENHIQICFLLLAYSNKRKILILAPYIRMAQHLKLRPRYLAVWKLLTNARGKISKHASSRDDSRLINIIFQPSQVVKRARRKLLTNTRGKISKHA